MFNLDYEKIDLPIKTRVFAGVVHGVVTLLFFSIIGFLFNYFFIPFWGEKKTLNIFMFVVFLPSVLIGSFLGNFIAHRIFVLPWKNSNKR